MNKVLFFVSLLLAVLFIDIPGNTAEFPPSAASSSSSSPILENLKRDTEQLKHIALTIFLREQDSKTLENKMCLHSEPVLHFWSTHPMWNDLDTNQRKALVPPIPSMTPDWMRGLLRKDSLASFTPHALTKFRDLTAILIKSGIPTLEENAGKKGYTIVIKHMFEESVGYDTIKTVEDKKVKSIKQEPLYDLLLVVDITAIVDALSSGEKYDLSKMGYISTICPTQR